MSAVTSLSSSPSPSSSVRSSGGRPAGAPTLRRVSGPVLCRELLFGRARFVGRARLRDETGAVTAEYAIVIMAAVSFAGVLVTVLRSGQVQSMLTELVKRALSVG